MNKLGIIVAAYNAEKFIEQCILSFLNNTSLFETGLIIVNDGSTDSTLNLLNKYRDFDNIIILSKENGGLSSARNVGIDYAKGRFQYISFLDADDYISSDYIEIINSKVDADIDIIEFNITRFGGRKNVSINPSLGLECQVLIDENILLQVFSIGLWFSVARVYSIRLFDDLSFPNGKNYEDVYLVPQLYLKSSKLLSLNDHLYFYRDNPDGITRNATSKNVKDIISAVDFLCNYNLSNELSSTFKKSTFKSVIYVLSRLPNILPDVKVVNLIRNKFDVSYSVIYINFIINKIRYISYLLLKRLAPYVR